MSELTIVEQLALIAQDAEAEYQAILMWACLSVLVACALAGVVYTVRLSAAERQDDLEYGTVPCLRKLKKKGKWKMNVSKIKIAWKFLTGGREGVLDYALDVSNTFADRLPNAKKEDLKEHLATAHNILGTLNSLSWLCPTRWRQAYALTLSAFSDIVCALDDLKITPDELTAVCNDFHLAYAAWRAE